MDVDGDVSRSNGEPRRGRRLSLRRRSRRDAPATVVDAPPSLAEALPEPSPEPEPSSIGRSEELAHFRRLVGLAEGDATPGVVLALVGAAGSGKRWLLDEFAREARARLPPRCARVVDLSDPPELTELLDELARSLEPEGQAFKSFLSTLSKFRYRQERGRTRAMEYAEAGKQLTGIARDTAPTLATGVAGAVGAAAPTVVGAFEQPRDLESVKRDFLRGFARLADRDRSAPLVLLFSNLDRRPEDPTSSWIRQRLLVEATAAGALVALSVETEDALHQLPTDVPRIVMRLDALAIEDAFTFVESRLKISPRTRLARQVIEASGGYPERLARFEAYFERYPDARKLETLPEDALTWTSGGSVLEPFHRLEPPDVRRLVLCASSLRRFNEPLLQAVAARAGIAGDATSRAVAALVDSKNRPQWIAATAEGWTITPQIRAPLLDEFRRLDPALVRSIHEVAARYYRDRLTKLDSGAESLPDDPLDVFVPNRSPGDTIGDAAFVVALGEWLYHLAALDPEAGFSQMAAWVVDALFEEDGEAAARLLDLGPGVTLSDDLEASRRALANVALAVRDDRYTEAISAIEQLEALVPPQETLRVAIDHLLGRSAAQISRPTERVVARFERAESRLSCHDEPRMLRLRATNLQWLAYSGVVSTANLDEAMARLGVADEIATRLGDSKLHAEVRRARALVLEHVQSIDEALEQLELAVQDLSSIQAPELIAQILVDRGGLSCNRNDFDAARSELERAAQIARGLDDPSLEATARSAMMRVELAAGDDEAASDYADEVVALRPFDAYVRNRLGVAYFDSAADSTDPHSALERSVRMYSAALQLADEALIFSNRGYAHHRLAHLADPPIESELRAAAADFDEAARRGLSDPQLHLDAAELQLQLGDARASSAHARAAIDVVARAAVALGGAASEATWGLVDAVLPLLKGGERSALERLASAYPSDARGHYLLGLSRRDGSRHDLNGAAEALEQAIALAESDTQRVDYSTALADVWCAIGDWRKAERRVKEALKIDPEDVRANAVRLHIIAKRRRDRYETGGDDSSVSSPLRLEIGAALVERIDPERSGDRRFFDLIDQTLRPRIDSSTGFRIPGLRCAPDWKAEPLAARLLVHGAPLLEFVLPGEYFAAASPEACEVAAGIKGTAVPAPWGDSLVSLVPETAVPDLAAAGITVWDAVGAVAATLERPLRVSVPSLITAEDASWTAYAHSWSVAPPTLPALTGLVRDLAAAGVSPDDVDDAFAEGGIDAAVARLEEITASADRRRPGDDSSDPTRYAIAFEGTAPATSAPVTLRLAAEDGLDEVGGDAGAALTRVCEWLSLPKPDLDVVHDPHLPADAFELAIGGCVRVAATVAGARALSARYCGAARRPNAGRNAVIAGAIETALRDDPSLLLPVPTAARLAEKALEAASLEGDAGEWAETLRRVVAMRAPLGDKLSDAIQAVAGGLSDGSGGRPASALESRPNRPIPDGLTIGARDTLTFERRGQVSGIHIDVTIRHRDPHDLRVRLIAPDGQEATLHDRTWVFGRDLRLTLETPSAAELEPLLGVQAEGDWTVHVQDLLAGDGGTLAAWSLELELDGRISRPDEGAAAKRIRAIRQVAEAEQLAYALRRYEIEVRLGDRLAEAVGVAGDDAGPPEAVLGPLNRLSRRLGIPVRQTIHWRRSDDIAPCAYELIVNGLVRAGGDVPVDHRLVHGASSPVGPDAAFDPNGGVGTWVPDIGDAAPGELPMTATRFVVSDIAAVLRDCNRDLVDLGAVEQMLDTTAVWGPLLGDAIRDRYPAEVLAATLARISDFGLSIRDARVLDCLLNLEPAAVIPESFDAATVADGDPLSPDVLAEYVAERLADTVAFLHLGYGPVEVVELDAAAESDIREALATRTGAEPVYGASAAPLLRMLEQRLCRADPDTVVVLAASPDIRRHVRRLIAAQFPRLSVLSLTHLAAVPGHVDPATRVSSKSD